jgi:hypothetical protein
VSLWPGFDLNGEGLVTDRFALGFISGGDRLDCLAVSLAANWFRDEAKGFEIGLVGYAGVLRGLQGSLVNVEDGEQGGDGYGAQLGAVVNVAGGNFTGLQWSGMVNDASKIEGAQLGLINVAGSVTGAQLGLVNIAGDVKGLQLGLLNVAADSEVALGLLSFGGQLHADAWAGDTAAADVGIEFGSRRIYTILAFGYDTVAPQVKTYDYLGVGLNLDLGGHLWFRTDLGAGSTFETVSFLPPPQILVKWRFEVGYSFAARFAIFGGLSINGLFQLPGDTQPDVGYGAELNASVGQTQVHFWPGPYLGIRI